MGDGRAGKDLDCDQRVERQIRQAWRRGEMRPQSEELVEGVGSQHDLGLPAVVVLHSHGGAVRAAIFLGDDVRHEVQRHHGEELQKRGTVPAPKA